VTPLEAVFAREVCSSVERKSSLFVSIRHLLEKCVVVYCCLVAPKISRPPLSSHVTEGDDAMFDCQLSATAWPVTVVTWTFDQQPINVSQFAHVTDSIPCPPLKQTKLFCSNFIKCPQVLIIFWHIDGQDHRIM